MAERRGCMLEEFDYGAAKGVGYTEKRSQDDGLDASPTSTWVRATSA